ncbi:MAG: PAC2 family protein [Acidimicrobiales bacterium]
MTVVWRDFSALSRPILILAFEGWFDVAEAATGAVRWLANHYDADDVAGIDPEPYFDFTARRPEVKLVDGERIIEWPANDCAVARLPEHGHDLVLLAGIEPHLRWQNFCQDLIEVIRTTAAELVITLGATADAVPHSRPPLVKGSSTTAALASTLGLDRPSYQGPTGLIGVLHDRLDREHIPVISLRASVPHYVASSPNPKATLALLQHLEHVTGVPTAHSGLVRVAEAWERQVDAAVSADDEVGAYVRRLEEQNDRRLVQDLPSGEDLAAQFEQFLREQRPDEGPPPGPGPAGG